MSIKLLILGGQGPGILSRHQEEKFNYGVDGTLRFYQKNTSSLCQEKSQGIHIIREYWFMSSDMSNNYFLVREAPCQRTMPTPIKTVLLIA